MALSAATVWEVNVGGNASNSGGFVTGSGGTDYSISTSPHVIFDGATITASTGGVSATITITGYTVASTDVGNLLKITGGVNFATGYYQIISVNTGANTWDLDRNATSGAGSAMTGRMGGATDLISTVMASVVAGNAIFVMQGTFTKTVTETITLTGTNANPIDVVGYASTRSVGFNTDTKPLFTSATNSIVPLTLSNCQHVKFWNFKNTSTAATRGNGWANSGTGSAHVYWINCEGDGCLSAWASGASSATSFGRSVWALCVARNSTSHGWTWGNTSPIADLISCWADSNAGAGYNIPQAAALTTFTFYECGATRNGDQGIKLGTWTSAVTRLIIIGGTYSGNTGSGIYASSTSIAPTSWIIMNNVFYGNSAYGLNDASDFDIAKNQLFVEANAFGGNGTADRNGFRASQTDVALSADPFVNSATGDYRLNSTAGGGTALKAVGFGPQLGSNSFNGGANYLDIGALQAICTGSGGGSGGCVYGA